MSGRERDVCVCVCVCMFVCCKAFEGAGLREEDDESLGHGR